MSLEIRHFVGGIVVVAAAAACEGSPIAPSESPDAKGAVLASFLPYDLGSRGAPGSGCVAAGHRQFDFWVGNWDVNNAAARFVGTNMVERELDACVVEENWISIGGYRGRSMNTFDATTGRWNQMWVDNAGQPLFLEGGLEAGAMVMRGRRFFPNTSNPQTTVDDHITWTAITPDSVRQFWLISVNEGAPFTAFDGRYRRVDEVTPLAEVHNPLCSGDLRYRELDFLVGDWTIIRGAAHGVAEAPGDGPVASAVTTDLSGCLVEERIEGPGPYRVWSFNAFDPRTTQWHRTSIDNRGNRLKLAGSVEGSAMVLTGTRRTDAGMVHVRVALEPDGAGRVIERWEISTDGGATWREEARLTRIRRG